MSEHFRTVKDYFTTSEFTRDEVMDKLSEFLTVEQGGKTLYEAALKHVQHPEVSQKFHEFLQQTIRHEQNSHEHHRETRWQSLAIRSAGAKLADQKAKALLKSIGRNQGHVAGSDRDQRDGEYRAR